MRAQILLTLVGVLALTGCVSVVKVKPAGDQTSGIRYYLPQVFLQVTPASDGTMTVEKLYLPDKRHEYAISADSYLSSHKLEVDRDEKGFLKSVTFDSDGTALGQQVAASAAAIRAAQIDQKVAKAKADADQAKAAADKAKSALDAAEAARKAASTTLVVAQRKVDFLQQLKNPPKDIDDQLLEAQLAVVEAQAKKDDADAAYNALVASTQAPAIAANAANAGTANAWPQAFEPVFYRVDMSATSVTLKQAFVQNTRATFVMPKTDKAAPELAVYPESIAMRPTGKDGILSKGVQLNQEVKAVALKTFIRSDNAVPGDLPILSLQPGGTVVQIEVPKKTQPGHYELDIGITPLDAKVGDPPVKRTVKIWIEK